MGGPVAERWVMFEGHRLDPRTRDMVVAARVLCPFPLVISQGCYNAGGVAASAGTHDGGGAVDIDVAGLTADEIAAAVDDLRHVGFAAWHRLPSQGPWHEHIHCIAVGCPDLSPSAARQVTAYYNGRNGLANNGPDDGDRTYVGWTWEQYAATYPNDLTENTFSAQDATTILSAIAELRRYVEAVAVQVQKHDDQITAAGLADVKNYMQTMTIAGNNYTRQIEAGSSTQILAALAALSTHVDQLQQQIPLPAGAAHASASALVADALAAVPAPSSAPEAEAGAPVLDGQPAV